MHGITDGGRGIGHPEGDDGGARTGGRTGGECIAGPHHEGVGDPERESADRAGRVGDVAVDGHRAGAGCILGGGDGVARDGVSEYRFPADGGGDIVEFGVDTGGGSRCDQRRDRFSGSGELRIAISRLRADTERDGHTGFELERVHPTGARQRCSDLGDADPAGGALTVDGVHLAPSVGSSTGCIGNGPGDIDRILEQERTGLRDLDSRGRIGRTTPEKFDTR